MNFKDYIEELRKDKLSEQEKFLLYEKIFRPTYRKKFHLSSFNISMRQFTYLSILVFLFVGIFGIYYRSAPDSDKNKQFAVFPHIENSARAWYVANVVEFTGDFHIDTDTKTGNAWTWKIIKSSMINSNDRVVLHTGTIMSFDIIDGTSVKMVGPAVFSIQKSDNAPYKLFIEKWEYTSIKNNQTKKDKDAMEVIVDNNIAINITKEQTDFQIAKKGNEYYINNKWKDLIVHRLSSDTISSKKEQIVKKQEVLTLQLDNDTTIIQDQEHFAKALANREVSQTFALHLDEEKIGTTGGVLIAKHTPQYPNLEAQENQKDQEQTEQEKQIVQEIKQEIVEGTAQEVQGTVDDMVSKKTAPESIQGMISQITQNTWQEITKKTEEELHKEELEKILSADQLEIDTEVIDTLLSGNKKVFSEQQNKQLKKTFNTFFLWNNLKDIMIAYLVWEQDQVDTAFQVTNKKFLHLAELLGYDIQDIQYGQNEKNFILLKENLQYLNKKLQAEYYFPEYYQENIAMFIAWIEKMRTEQFSSVDNEQQAEERAKQIIS